MIKDWRGTEIEVGDTVLYAVVNSSSIIINEAVVAEITTFNPGYGKDRPRIVVDWKRDSHNCDRAITRVNLSKPRNLTVIKKVEPPPSIYGAHTEERHPEWDACR